MLALQYISSIYLNRLDQFIYTEKGRASKTNESLTFGVHLVFFLLETLLNYGKVLSKYE